jgi:hypothetical protein
LLKRATNVRQPPAFGVFNNFEFEIQMPISWRLLVNPALVHFVAGKIVVDVATVFLAQMIQPVLKPLQLFVLY